VASAKINIRAAKTTGERLRPNPSE